MILAALDTATHGTTAVGPAEGRSSWLCLFYLDFYSSQTCLSYTQHSTVHNRIDSNTPKDRMGTTTQGQPCRNFNWCTTHYDDPQMGSDYSKVEMGSSRTIAHSRSDQTHCSLSYTPYPCHLEIVCWMIYSRSQTCSSHH